MVTRTGKTFKDASEQSSRSGALGCEMDSEDEAENLRYEREHTKAARGRSARRWGHQNEQGHLEDEDELSDGPGKSRGKKSVKSKGSVNRSQKASVKKA